MKLQSGFDRTAKRAGVALVSVLVVIMGLLVLLTTFHQLTERRSRESRASADDRRAFYLAETALNEGMTAVRAGRPGGVGSAAAPAYFGGGVFWVESTLLDPKRTRLLATAMVGGGRSALEAVVEIYTPEPLFDSVLNSKEPLGMAANVRVDSYASAVGSYASQVVNTHAGYAYANAGGNVSSNEDIHFASGAWVFGDATPGPGHACSLAGGTYVSGSTAAATDVFTVPSIKIPAIPVTGSYNVAAGSTATLVAGNYSFNALSIGTSARLKIKGPAKVVCDDFTGEMYGKLEIDATNGPVTIYVKDDYTHVNKFEAMATPGSPMALAFMLCGSDSISFPPKANLRGAYYAPNADITFSSGSEVWGAFAAESIHMTSGIKFHYDESLKDYWANAGNGGDPLDVLVWRHVQVTPQTLAQDHRDPFTVLGVDKNLLASPAQCWL